MDKKDQEEQEQEQVCPCDRKVDHVLNDQNDLNCMIERLVKC